MYQLFFDKFPLYDPRDDDLVIREPDVHLAVGEAGTVSFIIDPDHPYAAQVTRMKGAVELRAEGLPIFKGRVRKDTRAFDKSREIEVEGLLACLNDSVIPPFNFPEDFLTDPDYIAAAESGNVVEFFLGWVLTQHNAQVGPSQKILLGDVTVTDPNNYISRASSDHLTAVEVVRNKLEDTLGGYLLADYSGETTVLHYYADLPLTNIQSVEFGENLLDLVLETDTDDTYTAILPVGKDGLTIADLPDGEIHPGYFKKGAIIYSQEDEELYGGARITRMVEWKDVTVADNLQTKAYTELATNGVKQAQTITVKAVDLGGVDNMARFVVGRYVELMSTPHGISATYPLMELEPNILDPGDTEITLGAKILTSSDLANHGQSQTQQQLDQQRQELQEMMGNTVEGLTQTIRSEVTSAVQSSESIVLAALENYVETSNYEEFKNTIQTQFEVMAGEINMKFTETTEKITNVNGDLQKTVETLYKYIRFVDGNIILGEAGNALTLRIENDRISFLDGGAEVAYFSNKQLYVLDGHFLNSLRVGRFAFLPRENGNLSLVKVSD